MSDRANPPKLLVVGASYADVDGLLRELTALGSPAEFVVNPADYRTALERHAPDIVLLAFADLDSVEHLLPDVTRGRPGTPAPSAWRLLLCDPSATERAEPLCAMGAIDDYLVHWPTPLDGHRLKQSLRLGHRFLDVTRERQHALVDMQRADQAVRLSRRLDTSLEDGERHTRDLSSAVDRLGSTAEESTQKMIRLLDTPKPGEVSSELLRRQVAEKLSNQITDSVRDVSTKISPLTAWFSQARADVHQVVRPGEPLPMPQESAAHRILVVDDDRLQHRIMGALLRELGADIRYANNGIEALQICEEQRPDLILMDYMMPDAPGLSLIHI